MCYTKATDSSMYLCSMDAEKCFDIIWHAGLLNKLFNVLPDIHWRILHNWYSNMKSVVKWNGTVYNNSCFKITRGTRQGSIFSPVLFNVVLSLTLYISLIIIHMTSVLVTPCIIALHSLTIYLFSVVRFQGFNVLLMYVVITQRSGMEAL